MNLFPKAIVYTALTKFLLLGVVLPMPAAAAQHGLPERCGFTAVPTIVAKTPAGVGAIAGTTRPILAEQQASQSGRFLVHFTREGTDAVPLLDEDGNGIPDFVDVALETLDGAWDAYVGMGYTPPPSDGGTGGSAATDVYLHDLSKAGNGGTGLYGNTIPEQRVSSGPPERFTAWMEFDNDFDSTDRNLNGNRVFATPGTDGLRITAVHELHHVFQVGSYGVSQTQTMVYEFTSTWMEQRLYPEIPDWILYASNLFRMPAAYPFSGKSGTTGYIWAFFNRFLYGKGEDELLVDTWQYVGLNEAPFTALVHACNDNGIGLSQTFCDNLPAFYHTGNRDRADDSLHFGNLLPEITLAVDQQATAPSELFSGSLHPFELRAYRLSVPSYSGEDISTAIIATWPNEAALKRADDNEVQPFRIVVTATPEATDIPIQGTAWGVRYEPADLCVWIDGSATKRVQAPYPQPVKLSSTKEIFLPTPAAKFQEEVTTTIYTTAFVAVQHATAKVELDDDRLVVPITLSTTVTPGMYLVEGNYKGQTWLTKLVVQP